MKDTSIGENNGTPRRPRPRLPGLAVGGGLLILGVAIGHFSSTRAGRITKASVGAAEDESGPLAPPAEPPVRARATLSTRAVEPPVVAARPFEPEAVPEPAKPAASRQDPTAEEARDAEVARIKTSGPDLRNLAADARRVGQDWSKAVAEAGVDVKFDDWSCYRAGCITNVRHAGARISDVTSKVTRSRAFLDWNGEKLRSGPIDQPDGRIEVTWILYAPVAGQPALATAEVMQP